MCRPDVVYVPTPQKVVDAMLWLAQVKESDVVYDLPLDLSPQKVDPNSVDVDNGE